MIATHEPGLKGPPVAGVDVGDPEAWIAVLDVQDRVLRGVAAAGPAPRDTVLSSIARERAASPVIQAAVGDAAVELLSSTEAPGANGAPAIARHRIGLPEREGVGER
jgi:hypothetical protein